MNSHMHRVVHYGEEVTCPSCGNRRRVLLRCDDGENRCGPCYSGMEDERGKFIAATVKKLDINWFALAGWALFGVVLARLVYAVVKR